MKLKNKDISLKEIYSYYGSITVFKSKEGEIWFRIKVSQEEDEDEYKQVDFDKNYSDLQSSEIIINIKDKKKSKK